MYNVKTTICFDVWTYRRRQGNNIIYNVYYDAALTHCMIIVYILNVHLTSWLLQGPTHKLESTCITQEICFHLVCLQIAIMLYEFGASNELI